jgi:hypothetical protein
MGKGVRTSHGPATVISEFSANSHWRTGAGKEGGRQLSYKSGDLPGEPIP